MSGWGIVRVNGDLRYRPRKDTKTRLEPKTLYCIDCKAEFKGVYAKRCPECTKRKANEFQKEYYQDHKFEYKVRCKVWRDKRKKAKEKESGKQSGKGNRGQDSGSGRQPKRIWHPYQLQSLAVGKFIVACNAILAHEWELSPIDDTLLNKCGWFRL